MYHPEIVDKNVWAVEKQLGTTLIPYPDDSVDERTDYLKGLVKSYTKEGSVKEWNKEPTQQEWDYINNERVLCKYNFDYWAKRYAVIELAAIEGRPNADVGRLGLVGFMRPQEILLEKMAAVEKELYEQVEQGHMVDGLRYFINKGRQLHFTALSRMLSNHRTFFWPDTNAIASSVNEDMVGELYRRDKVMYDNLPWFLRPQMEYDTKNQQLSFSPLGSGTIYHQANQHGGMGMGRMVPVAHMTEVAFWDEMAGENTCYEKLDFHLRAAIPQSLNTLYILESTSNGIGGWWYDQIQLILRGKSTFRLGFFPWYSADRKYRRTPPVGWEPNDDTKAMLAKVERTSPAYFEGRTITLDKEQAYWYESEKASYEKRLAVFLSNYPTDLGEAFQSFGAAAFSPELLNEIKRGVGALAGAYEFI